MARRRRERTSSRCRNRDEFSCSAWTRRFRGFLPGHLSSRSCPSSAQRFRRSADLPRTCCLDTVPCPCCVHAGHAQQDSACLDSLDNTRKGVQARVCPTSVSTQGGRKCSGGDRSLAYLQKQEAGASKVERERRCGVLAVRPSR